MINTSKLSNLQLELLQVFSADVDEKDLKNIRNMLADYFLNRAEKEIDFISEQKNLTAETFQQWASEHNRSTS